MEDDYLAGESAESRFVPMATQISSDLKALQIFHYIIQSFYGFIKDKDFLTQFREKSQCNFSQKYQ